MFLLSSSWVILLAFPFPAGACWQSYHSCGTWHSTGLMCIMLGVTKWLGLEGPPEITWPIVCLSLTHPISYLYTVKNLFQAFSSPGWTVLALSSSPCMTDPPSTSFVVLHWTHSSNSMSFLHWGAQNWMQCSRCGFKAWIVSKLWTSNDLSRSCH